MISRWIAASSDTSVTEGSKFLVKQAAPTDAAMSKRDRTMQEAQALQQLLCDHMEAWDEQLCAEEPTLIEQLHTEREE